MSGWRILAELKRDVFGGVELLGRGEDRLARRVVRGSRVPGSAWLAGVLLRREARALSALEGLAGVPRLVPAPEEPEAAALACLDGHRPPARRVLLRTWIEGEPLHLAPRLPLDFFDRLDALVGELHRRGVCHNDLHKEQNVLVGRDGAPGVIDFQLASVHAGAGGRRFAARVHEDLRHVQKTRRRYTRDGRAPAGMVAREGAGAGRKRGRTARVWLRVGKPVYVFVTRRVLGRRDGEARRESSGPWPEWVEDWGDG